MNKIFGSWSDEDKRADRRSIGVAAVLLGISFVSRGLTEIAEAARAGIPLSDSHVWVLEATSHVSLWLLAPLVILLLNKAPLGEGRWKRSVPFHILAGIGFSLAHVTLMWPARLLLFPPLVGYPYTFSLMAPASLRYELTKDMVTYALMVAGFLANRLIERRAHDARALRRADAAAGRLTLGAGGTTVVVPVKEIVFAKAADNYVEVHTGDAPHLVRMTLSSLEARLAEQGATHARVHRSYIVGTAHIRAIVPTGEGDVDILLANGAKIPGSRRYRDKIAHVEASAR